MRGTQFLVHGHMEDLPHITCMHLLSFKICSQFLFVSAILHHISLLRLLPKSYFKISTFQPTFLCFSSFNNRIQPYKYKREYSSKTCLLTWNCVCCFVCLFVCLFVCIQLTPFLTVFFYIIYFVDTHSRLKNENVS